MAVTRIKSNQIADQSVTNAKIADYAIQGGKLANSLTYGSDLTVSGNLTVNGTTTTVDTVTTTIDDPILLLGSNQTGAASVDLGILGERGDDTNVFMGYDESADEFVMALTSTGDSNSAVAITDYVDTHVGGLTVDDNASVGGTLDVTGNASSANLSTGNVTASGDVAVTGDVSSATSTVSGDATVGGALSVTGNTSTADVSTGNVTASGSVSSASLSVSGNAGISGALEVGSVASGDLDVYGNVTATGNATVTGDLSSSTLTKGDISGAAGTFTGALDVTKTATVGNLSTSGTVTATGDISGANVSTGNVTASGSASVTGDISGANVSTGNVTASGDVASATSTVSGDATVGGTLDVTGDISGANVSTGNLTASGDVTVTGDISGANVSTGNVTASGDVSSATSSVSGDATVGGTLDVTGNASSANLSTGNVTATGSATVTGDISGANLSTGNVTASGSATVGGTLGVTGETTLASATVSDLTAGRITFAGTAGSLTDSGNLTWNGTKVGVTGQVSATGTVTGGNLETLGATSTGTLAVSSNGTVGGTLGVTSTATVGNLSTAGTVSATGNVSGGNLTTAGDVTTATLTASSNATVAGTLGVTGTSTLGNVVISNNTLTASGSLVINEEGADVDFRVESDTNANMLVVDGGTNSVLIGTATATTGASFKIGTTDSIMLPVGTSAERPTVGAGGMVRYNSSTDQVEYYDVSEERFKPMGVPEFTVIQSEVFDGDDATVTFTLSSSQTTQSCIVAINGVVQLPTSAYAVSGTTLTFTEAPATGDKIEVRELTTTTTVAALTNGNQSIAIETLNDQIAVTGDMIPTIASDGTTGYSLGSPDAEWKDDYVSQGSLYVNGQKVLQEEAGTIVVSADTNQNVSVQTSGSGDIELDPTGTGIIQIKGTLQIEDGTNITNSTGNAVTFASPIATDALSSKTADTDLVLSGKGTGIVRVADSLTISGDLTVNGTTTTINSTVLTVDDKNIILAQGAADSSAANGAGLTIDGANATLTYAATGDKWSFNKDVYTSGVFQGTATSAQYADLAEKYEADAEYAPGTVLHFGGDKEVTVCDTDHCTRTAGVVSTAPAYRMNDGLEAEFTAMVALTGRVPCKVKGPVRKGDMMVSAGNGFARAEANPKVGAVIGKSLENFDGEEGLIEVVVGKH